MSKILADLTQPARRKIFLNHTHIVRDDGGLNDAEPGKPVGAKIKGKRMPSQRWNALSFPERVPTHEPLLEPKATTRQRQAPLRPKTLQTRLYRPQDQRGVYPVFVIYDRDQGQPLARVRGTLNHVEVEAEKLARSQGFELSDLKILIQGDL